MSQSQNTSNLDAESLLLQAADEFTESAQRGERPNIEQYARRYPGIGDTIRRVFPALASLHDVPNPPLSAINVMDETLGDFLVIEEIGRGGMGIVYRAQEVSLNRTVALKVLPIAGMLNDQTLSRFKNKARAAASLSHPNIVPVYSVGEHRGVHYYVMRLIHGKSMAELIDEMRRDNGPSSGNDMTQVLPGPLDDTRAPSDVVPTVVTQPEIRNDGSPAFFRRVATWGVQAAHALAHAHAHGVLHRDVKPANLMIDANGHLWVTDFGLARLDGDVGISVSGDLMGTFRYMSPEQALGRRIMLDQRSDIYSLSVTLYELLTLQPVFASDNTLELLRQIAFENPTSPRKLNRAIPIELDTILMKGMEKDPDRRYATAQELADDLQRFLDHRPVKAKPPTLVEAATKWSLRHQAIVWASLATVVLTIATLIISMLVIGRAYTIASNHRARAETNLRLARSVIDDTYSKQIEQLKNEPGMTQEQRRSILRLVQFYEQLPREELADPLLGHDACKARLNLADIYLVMGQSSKAILTYREVIGQADALCKLQPANAIFQHTLAMAHDGLGQALYGIQRYQPSIDSHGKALEIARQLRQRFPQDLTFQRLAICQVHLARANRDTDVKERTLREAISTLEELVVAFPRETSFESYLADAQDELGMILRATGRHREAESQFRNAIEVHERLAQLDPQLPSHRYQLAKTTSHLAQLQQDLRRFADAEVAHQDAVKLLIALSGEYPHRVVFRSELAKAHNELGTLFSSDQRMPDAAESYRAAIALLELLTAEAPEAPEYRADLASNYNDLGVVMMRLGDATNSRKLLSQSIDIWQTLVNEFPKNPEYEKNVAIVNSNASRFLKLKDRLAAYQQTVNVLTDLSERFPERIEYRQSLIRCISSQATELRIAGQLERSERLLLKAIQIADEFSKTNPELPQYYEAAGQFTAFGNLSLQLGKFKQSAEAHQMAVENYRLLRELSPDKMEYRDGLCSNLKRLGYARSRAGHYEEALACYLESIQLADELSRDFPDKAKFIGKLSRRYQLLGALHLERGEYADAERAFLSQWESRSKLLSDFPEYKIRGLPNSRLLVLLANVIQQQDASRWPEAVKHLLAASELSIASGDLLTGIRLHLQLADIYRSNGNAADAQHAVDQAVRHLDQLCSTSADQPEKPELSLHACRWHVAAGLHRNGDAASARELFETLLQQDLSDATWNSAQAWYLANWPDASREQLELAMQLASEAVEDEPNNPLHGSMLGVSQFRLGDYTAAARSLATSLHLSKNGSVVTLLYLAMTHSHLGEAESAREFLDQAESRIMLADPLHVSSYRELRDEAKRLVDRVHPE